MLSFLTNIQVRSLFLSLGTCFQLSDHRPGLLLSFFDLKNEELLNLLDSSFGIISNHQSRRETGDFGCGLKHQWLNFMLKFPIHYLDFESKNSRSSMTQPQVMYHHPGFHPDSRHHWRLHHPRGHWWFLYSSLSWLCPAQSPPICRSLCWSSRTCVRYSLEARHNCILPTCILNPVLMNSLSHETHESGQWRTVSYWQVFLDNFVPILHITHSDLCKPSCSEILNILTCLT